MRKCDTKQKVMLMLPGGSEIAFYDKHANKKRTCVGDPCELLLHAELQMLVYCARWGGHKKLDTSNVRLEHIPCMACARMLAETGLKHLIMAQAPEGEEQEKAIELLATRIPTTIEIPEVKNGSDSGQDATTDTVKRKPRRSKRSAKKAS